MLDSKNENFPVTVHTDASESLNAYPGVLHPSSLDIWEFWKNGVYP